jgi:inorganic triphosphatase YgiF
MNEFELKLVFPVERLTEIEKFVISKGGIRRQKLQAFYFDTDAFTLAKAGIAIRIRKEGRFWIQTLKANSTSQFGRLEHNVVIQHVGSTVPLLNVHLHHEHPAHKVLIKVLRDAKHGPDQLSVRYQTDIWRRPALVRARGAMLEYALDIGMIKAYQSNGEERLIPVRELEIELKSGDKLAVINHAKVLISRFSATIDTRSKAQRGYLAARGLSSSPPTRAKEVTLPNQHDGAIAAVLLNSCIDQILPNVSEINAGLEAFDEHIHQLRVGLRRLKSAMKVLGLIQIYLTESDLKQLILVFGQLGQYRDHHFFDEKLKPALSAVDAPDMSLTSVSDLPDPKGILQAKNFQLFCLSIIEISIVQEKSTSESKRLKPLLIQELNKVLKETKQLASCFMEIPDERRHKLRKRLKHLRYTLEFFTDFCNTDKYKNYLRSLGQVLEALGHYNDICVAIEKSQERLSVDSNILFAMGWLKAERTRSCIECAQAVKTFSEVKKIW